MRTLLNLQGGASSSLCLVSRHMQILSLVENLQNQIERYLSTNSKADKMKKMLITSSISRHTQLQI